MRNSQDAVLNCF